MRVGRKTKFSVLIVLVFSIIFAIHVANTDLFIADDQASKQTVLPISLSDSAVPCADPDWPFNIWIDGGSYHYFYAYRTEGTALYGSFDVLTSSGIDFFVCDQSNFDIWTSGYTASVYTHIPSTGGADWTFIVPHSDTWYMVYDNTGNLFYQSHVEGTHRLDNTAPSVNLNLDDGSTYSGTVVIAASASDEGFGVTSLILYIDGVLTDAVYNTSLSYSWNTASFQDGPHTIRVRADDGAGHVTNVEIDVNVSNVSALLVPAAAAGVGIVAIIGVAFVFSRRTKRPVEGQMMAPLEGLCIGSQYPTQEYIERPPARQLVAFCPSCGAARSPPNAHFCGNCGASFPD